MLLKGLLYDENCPTWFERDGSFPIWASSEDNTQPLPQFEKDVIHNIKRYTHLAEGVIVNGTAQLESHSLSLIRQNPTMQGKKIFMVGPLIPNEKSSDKDKPISDWLDKQQPGQVAYISLGTIATPHPEQVVEMARAFYSMGKPFIWSLPVKLHHHIPENIRNEMASSRFLISGWAPQKLILSHKSTGLFVSHCGWNSTLETLVSGIPVLCWPMFADQGLNADLLVKKGLAVLVEGTGMKPKRLVPANEIIELARGMLGDMKYRTEAAKWENVMDAETKQGGTTQKQLLQLIEELA